VPRGWEKGRKRDWSIVDSDSEREWAELPGGMYRVQVGRQGGAGRMAAALPPRDGGRCARSESTSVSLNAKEQLCSN